MTAKTPGRFQLFRKQPDCHRRGVVTNSENSDGGPGILAIQILIVLGRRLDWFKVKNGLTGARHRQQPLRLVERADEFLPLARVQRRLEEGVAQDGLELRVADGLEDGGV